MAHIPKLCGDLRVLRKVGGLEQMKRGENFIGRAFGYGLLFGSAFAEFNEKGCRFIWQLFPSIRHARFTLDGTYRSSVQQFHRRCTMLHERLNGGAG